MSFDCCSLSAHAPLLLLMPQLCTHTHTQTRIHNWIHLHTYGIKLKFFPPHCQLSRSPLNGGHACLRTQLTNTQLMFIYNFLIKNRTSSPCLSFSCSPFSLCLSLLSKVYYILYYIRFPFWYNFFTPVCYLSRLLSLSCQDFYSKYRYFIKVLHTFQLLKLFLN